MKPFHTIAIPHKDILEGRLTMDVFAADLWEVYQNRGTEEYRDAETFFKKTYVTQGLQNLLDIVERRVTGKGGDPVIQIQTPFGGGKTHAMIAMYHKAVEWNVKRVVVVGTSLSPQETLWGVIEKQLTGKITEFSGRVAPGKESIRKLLFDNQPVIILMDEVLEYVTKAAGVRVEASTLAAQTIAFMQELTEAVSALEKVCLVVTLPSSIIEHYDEGAEKLYQQLQKVAGRVEKIYTPVEESEITWIIRKRLFSDLNEHTAKKIVNNFVGYAEKEGILPAGSLSTEYRDRFISSYPFMPEVIDTLYHRWGSYPTFQRTRGVLRLLSLVIHALKEANKPYISLSDFDLANQEIRQELLKHIGAEYNGIISADITHEESGAKKIDASLGRAYRGLGIGTRSVATIFLYSFSGGIEHGATMGEIKRSATTLENPASVVAEAIEQLKSKLFYLQSISEKYFFSNQPNLNRILIKHMENVKDHELVELERDLLKNSIKGGRLKVTIWEENSGNIVDSEELKLVILRRENSQIMNDILKNKGQTPRVYRNTMFFLCPLEAERPVFNTNLKRKIAYENIEQDKTLNLSDEQKKEVRKELKKAEEGLRDTIRRLYRMIIIPGKDGFLDMDMGIPTYGEQKCIDEEVYDKLRSNGHILIKIAPLVLREKYLSNKEYVHTEQLYQSLFRTPGETRIDKIVLEKGINEGVRMGLFGLGEMENDKPICRYFKELPTLAFSGNEVMINEAVCREQWRKKELSVQDITQQEISEIPGPAYEPTKKETDFKAKTKDKVQLKFQVPKGKISNIMGVMNLLQNKFETLQIELVACDGNISEQDYEDKIKEAFRQMGIELNEE